MGLVLDEPNEKDQMIVDDIHVLIDNETKSLMKPSVIDCFSDSQGNQLLALRGQYNDC